MPTVTLPRPHAGQERVLSERKRFNVVACGRRWGKTKEGSTLAIEAAIAGYPVGWFAPSYKLLKDAQGEILARMRDAPGLAKYRDAEKRMEFSTGGVIEFWSTQPEKVGDDESEVARGRKYARIIYDEAAHARRLKADWTRAIRPTLADYGGDAWFFSTPRGRDYFYELFMRGQSGEKDWASWRMPTSSNPHIDPEEIESARRDIPKDAFEQEYLAEFLANAANPFGIDAIRACIQDGLSDESVQWWGVDLAKKQDWTVNIGLDWSGRVTVFDRWQADWGTTRTRLMAALKGSPSLIDSTGVGDPIVEDLQKALQTVEGYHFTSQSKQQLMEGLAFAIQNRTVSYPDGEIVRELESFQYEYTRTGVRYSAPDGLHDDCVCALALAVMCRATRPRFDWRIMAAGSGAKPLPDRKLTDDSRHWRDVEVA